LADNVEVLAVSVLALSATQIPALVLSMRAATAGMSLLQLQFIAGAVAAKGMAVAAGVARVALALLGGPVGIVFGLLTAAAGAFLIFRDNSGDAETASYDAAAGTAALMGELDALADDAAPAASAAVIDLANNNIKLADSAYEAAKAEVAKRRALLSKAQEVPGGGRSRRGSILGAERLLNEELERLASSEAALAAAMRDRKVVSEEIIMTQTVVTDKTDEASVAAKKLADELRAAGGGARSAAAEVEELPKALEKTSDGFDTFKSSVASAFEGLITGASSFKDALGSVLKSLANVFAQAASSALFGPNLLGGIIPRLCQWHQQRARRHGLGWRARA